MSIQRVTTKVRATVFVMLFLSELLELLCIAYVINYTRDAHDWIWISITSSSLVVSTEIDYIWNTD